MYNVFAFGCQECWEIQNLLIFLDVNVSSRKNSIFREINFCLVMNIAGLTSSLRNI